QLQTKLAAKTIDPRTMAAHSPKETFRALATYKVLEGSALSRASKEAADKNTVRYRNLYRKIEEQDRQREASAKKQASAWPPWMGSALTIGGIVLGVLLL